MTSFSKTRLFGVSLTFLILSGAAFGVLIWKAEKLTAYGLTENVYYFALVPLGLSAAVLLFGVMHSKAYWKGTVYGGALELGGPVVLFLLVEILGFSLMQNSSAFPLTVYVHGEAGPHEVVLRNSGKVVMRLGLEARSELIEADGQALFPVIPANFRNQFVPVWVESDEFEAVGDVQHQLTSPSIDLTVRKKSGKVSGRIEENKDIFIPIPGAGIRIAGVTATTGPGGDFEITIPGDRMQSQLDIDVSATGFAPMHTTVVPNSNPAVIKLRRSR